MQIESSTSLLASMWSIFPGGYGWGDTPVPIPNTEVKPPSADGTALATVWESRSLPGSIVKAPSRNREGAFVCTTGNRKATANHGGTETQRTATTCRGTATTNSRERQRTATAHVCRAGSADLRFTATATVKATAQAGTVVPGHVPWPMEKLRFVPPLHDGGGDDPARATVG